MSEPADEAEKHFQAMDGKVEQEARKACNAKHTKYQPTEAEFCCPKCDAKVGDLCIDEPDGEANPLCPDLHEGDGVACYGKNGKGCPARYGASGKTFAALIAKKNDLVPCECCKGKGFMPRKKS
jgi:hypothetical protein